MIKGILANQVGLRLGEINTGVFLTLLDCSQTGARPKDYRVTACFIAQTGRSQTRGDRMSGITTSILDVYSILH